MKTTNSQLRRIARLAPNGIPRWIRVYDNGSVDEPGGSIDRYTVIFTGKIVRKCGGEWPVLAMNESPFSPQGFGQHMSYPYPVDTIGKDGKPFTVWPVAVGRSCHLGKRVEFGDLPLDCKKCVWQDYADYWGIPNQMHHRPSVSAVAS